MRYFRYLTFQYPAAGAGALLLWLLRRSGRADARKEQNGDDEEGQADGSVRWWVGVDEES